MVQPHSGACLTCLSFQRAVDTFLPKQESSVIRSICLVACLSIAQPALAQDASAEAQWLKEFKTAQSVEADCFKSDLPEDCLPAIAAYDRVTGAPDATDAIRHDVFRYAVNVQRVYADHFVEAGDLKRGIAEYEKAWGAVMQHIGDGSHLHAAYENLEILLGLNLALDASDETEKTADAFGLFEQLVARINPEIDTLIQDKAGVRRRMAVNSIIQSEKFYTYLGQKGLRETYEAKAAGRSPTETATRAANAFKSAADWLNIAIKYDIGEFAGAGAYERAINVYLGWGDALVAGGKPAEALAYYEEIASLTDKLITPENLAMMKEQAKSFGLDAVGDYEVANLLAARVNGLVGQAEALSLMGEAADSLDLLMEAEAVIAEYSRPLLRAREGGLAIGRYYYVDAKHHVGSWTRAKEIWDQLDDAFKITDVRERTIISEIRAEAAKER
jgi:hypothetical protein